MSLDEVNNKGVVLVYDGECPVCKTYVRYLRVREAVGEVVLVDARQDGPWVNKVRQAGLDLDEGMALFYGGHIYHGADCIHMLALLSTRSGLFNRFNAAIFGSSWLSRIFYPVLRFGRNILLRILGKEKLAISQ